MGYIGNSLAQGLVSGANIQDGTVDTPDLKDGAVTLAKLAATGTKDATTFLRGDGTFAVVAVTPTAVSDQSNTSTGAFDVPSGTTAQRPASPNVGYVRFNTDTDCLENYTSSGWLKVSIPIPVISSITGNIYSGITTTLPLSGSLFGTSAATVRFISGATTKDVTVTPTSMNLISVAVPSEIYSLSSGSVVTVKVINSDNGVSNGIDKTSLALPTGGSIVVSGGYRYHTFTTTSNLTVPSGFSATASALVIAGGGSGGSRAGGQAMQGGGGGGAGGVAYTVSVSLTAGTYTATVGAGGAAADGNVQGNDGTSSSFPGATTAVGGGGGGAYNGGTVAGRSGGSGGGAGRDAGAQSGGSGTSGQGYAGGGKSASSGGGAGGGGAGGVGQDGPTSSGAAGNGGVGTNAYSAWATATSTGVGGYYAGGGGGAGYSGGYGVGGAGGGGDGGTEGSKNSVSGTANTGGGGGSDSNAGNTNGGSGIVIIRYPLPT